jgi:sugar lactone lactonase YvrE
MRWLWKDWPQPIVVGQTQNIFLKSILKSGEEWKLVADGYGAADALASDEQGEVFFRDTQSGKTYRIADQAKAAEELKAPTGDSRALAAGPDGRLYVGDSTAATIVGIPKDGPTTILASGIHADHLVVTHAGNVYLTEQGTGDAPSSKVWLIRPTGEKVLLDDGLNHAAGLVLSPDGLWLAVFENATHFGYSYRVKADGTVDARQRFYWLYVPDWADDSGAGSAAADRDGRLYVATRLGVQVLDRNGRSRAILPLPRGEATSLCFGGANFDVLYVTSGGSIYRRVMKVPGVPASAAPMKLPPWGAG